MRSRGNRNDTVHLQKVNVRKKERNHFDARHGTVTRPDNVQVRWPGDNERWQEFT